MAGSTGAESVTIVPVLIEKHLTDCLRSSVLEIPFFLASSVQNSQTSWVTLIQWLAVGSLALGIAHLEQFGQFE